MSWQTKCFDFQIFVIKLGWWFVINWITHLHIWLLIKSQEIGKLRVMFQKYCFLKLDFKTNQIIQYWSAKLRDHFRSGLRIAESRFMSSLLGVWRVSAIEAASLRSLPNWLPIFFERKNKVETMWIKDILSALLWLRLRNLSHLYIFDM